MATICALTAIQLQKQRQNKSFTQGRVLQIRCFHMAPDLVFGNLLVAQN